MKCYTTNAWFYTALRQADDGQEEFFHERQDRMEAQRDPIFRPFQPGWQKA